MIYLGGPTPHGYPIWVHSEEIVYFLNGSVFINVICGMFSTDHWRKISPCLKMRLTLFWDPFIDFIEGSRFLRFCFMYQGVFWAKK
jgi:hypothetical protein